MTMILIFRLDMTPPTVTSQEKGVYVRRGKPIIYTKEEVKKAKQVFSWYLFQHKPEEPLAGPVKLETVWTYPIVGRHKDGEYKATKPDTDNLIKLFKDCMTSVGFWKDDAQVAHETTVKRFGAFPGIDVRIESLPPGGDGIDWK